MSSLVVEHITRYRYAAPVDAAQHLAYLHPFAGEGQRIESFELAIDPLPQFRSSQVDRQGNLRICFSIGQPHQALTVRATSQVSTQPAPIVDPAATQPWEAVRERLRYAAGAPFEPASEFAFPSPYVPRLDALLPLAADAFTPGRPIAEGAIVLMHRVHADFAYRSASTSVETPLADVLARREGVCQDFAHLMIGALRRLGLAARYVSGYLLTEMPSEGAHGGGAPGASAPMLGADASHAWVAVWCPLADGSGACWLELDPTNDLLPSTGHVRVAIGRDYGDVTPLRGVIRGGGAHQLEVEVHTRRMK